LVLLTLSGLTAEAAPSFDAVETQFGNGNYATSAVDASADGAVVTGNFVSSLSTGSQAGFRDEVGSLPISSSDALALPGPFGRRRALGISPDGNFVAGTIGLPPTISDERAARWDASAGLTPQRFDDPIGVDVSLSVAEDAANDGTSVGWLRAVGASSIHAYRWLPDGSPRELSQLPNASFVFARAHGISQDATQIAGVARSDGIGENVAVRWTNGVAENLGTLPAGLGSWGWDLSLDGSTVVGWAGVNAGTAREAMRWVEAAGMTSLGALPDSQGLGEALAVSADGSIVGGFDTTALGEQAFLWDEQNGMRVVQQILIDLGLAADLSAWSLQRVTGLSADGRTLVGVGIDPSGVEKGWIATIPEPATGGLLLAGLLGLGLARRASSHHPPA